MLLRYIMSLFSDRYPFVNGEFIPPQTKATPEPKAILDVTKRIERSKPKSKAEKKEITFKELQAHRLKKKRGY